jgi:hypothetical protein
MDSQTRRGALEPGVKNNKRVSARFSMYANEAGNQIDCVGLLREDAISPAVELQVSESN